MEEARAAAPKLTESSPPANKARSKKTGRTKRKERPKQEAAGTGEEKKAADASIARVEEKVMEVIDRIDTQETPDKELTEGLKESVQAMDSGHSDAEYQESRGNEV